MVCIAKIKDEMWVLMTACGGQREDLRIKYRMEVTKWDMGGEEEPAPEVKMLHQIPHSHS
jgi:hypothetical protein